MEINQLIYFKTVAETEHITRASEQLKITQPALSRTIHRLESSVGTELFDRENNRITLNDAGRVFLKHVKTALNEIEDGKNEVLVMKGLIRRKIRFSITESGFIAAPLVSYLLKHPEVHIQQTIQSIDEMRESLEKGEVDFSISFSPMESEAIEWVPLVSEEILAFVGMKHPLSKETSISLNDLRNERFIFNNSSYNIRKIICDYCRRIGFEPDIIYEGFENEVGDKLLEHSMGFLFVPSTAYVFHVKEFPSPKIRGRPLRIKDGIGTRTMGILLKRGYRLSIAAKDFYDFLLQYFDSPEGKSLELIFPNDRG